MRRFDARDDLDDTVNRRLLPCNDQSIKVGWLYPLDVSDSFEAADRRSAKVEVGWWVRSSLDRSGSSTASALPMASSPIATTTATATSSLAPATATSLASLEPFTSLFLLLEELFLPHVLLSPHLFFRLDLAGFGLPQILLLDPFGMSAMLARDNIVFVWWTSTAVRAEASKIETAHFGMLDMTETAVGSQGTKASGIV